MAQRQIFKTKFTELTGVDHPIMCGGMHHVSGKDFVPFD
jgi:NAD(P)H-dependent flavin oxidoreductase YrpB (nitropropane dioxygenase family)